jgi:hypothetical protein
VFNILSHEGNASQNDIEIPSLPRKNGYHQESKQQMLARIRENKELSYSVGGSVN